MSAVEGGEQHDHRSSLVSRKRYDIAEWTSRTRLRPVEPNQLGQHVRITWVALRPRNTMPFAIPGHLQRVHRIHGEACGDQSLHPRATVGFDTDDHVGGFGVVGQVVGDQLVKLGETGPALREPASTQPHPDIIDKFDIMVIFGPVIP